MEKILEIVLALFHLGGENLAEDADKPKIVRMIVITAFCLPFAIVCFVLAANQTAARGRRLLTLIGFFFLAVIAYSAFQLFRKR